MKPFGTTTWGSVLPDAPPAFPGPDGELARLAAETAVIGVGNVVLSDDGAGVHALEALRSRWILPADVDLIEGHTSGLNLLPFLGDARRVVLIDAIVTEHLAPGELLRVQGADFRRLRQRITPHDVGVADLLGAADLIGCMPDEVVIWCVQAASTELGTELSAPVRAALAPLADRVAEQLAAWGIAVARAARTPG